MDWFHCDSVHVKNVFIEKTYNNLLCFNYLLIWKRIDRESEWEGIIPIARALLKHQLGLGQTETRRQKLT